MSGRRLTPEELVRLRNAPADCRCGNMGSEWVETILGHIDAIEAELKDANYWRERHCKEAEEASKQSAVNWFEIQGLKAEIKRLETIAAHENDASPFKHWNE